MRKDFKPIEAIVILGGTPLNWESALQLILDIIVTNGDPRNSVTSMAVASSSIPVFILNEEMLSFNSGTFDRPRFSKGAFLECLQALYKVSKFFK